MQTVYLTFLIEREGKKCFLMRYFLLFELDRRGISPGSFLTTLNVDGSMDIVLDPEKI